MVWYIVDVYVHIIAAVLLIGYSLFWTIMAIATRQAGNAPESTRLLEITQKATWPPVNLLPAWRLPLPGLAWAFILVLIFTGIFALGFRGFGMADLWSGAFGPLLWCKLAAVAVMLVSLLVLTASPVRWIMHVNFGLGLVIIVVSALMVR